jgi:O-antigen/teichoic acid export membrane protein
LTTLARNATSIVIGEIGSRLLGFVTVAYLARILKPESFGLISVAFAVFGYLIIFSSFGIPQHALRLIAQRKSVEGDIAGDILGLRVFFAFCGLIAVALFSLIFIRDETLFFLIFFYGLSVIPIALNLEWFFQGKETMQAVGWSRIVGNLVYVLSLVIVVRSHEDILSAPIAFLVGSVAASALTAAWYFKQRGSFVFHWRPASLFRRDGNWRGIARRSMPIGIGAILTQVSYNTPPILLGLLSGVTAAGLFSAASRLVFFLLVFDRLVSTLLLPAIVRYQKFAPDQFVPMLMFVQKIVLILAFPLCVGGSLVAGDIMEFIYGQNFAGSIPVFQIFIWYFFFSVASSVYTFGLLGIEQEKVYGRVVMQGTLVQIAAVLVGIIVWGEVGAAAGYVAGEVVLFWLMYSSFTRFYRFDLSPLLIKPLLAAIIMGVVLLPLLSYGLVITISSGALVFTVLLIAMKGFTKEDFAILRTKLL